MTEFNQWLADIVELSGLPDNLTTRRASALFIFSIPPTQAAMSKRKIVIQLLKAASNQVAAEVVKDVDENIKAAKLSAAPNPLVSNTGATGI
jgi:hypothetical protein